MFRINPNTREIAKFIDHTLLKPQTTQDDVKRICHEAERFGFASVCINPVHVSFCRKTLKGSDVKVCTVVDFPLGANKSQVKALQARLACDDGADELDMVANIGALISKDSGSFGKDIETVIAAKSRNVILKVIIETAVLTDEEKRTAAKIIKDCGADFVKTSTGFGPGGATPYDVALLRKVVGEEMGVKASGGIRTYAQAVEMIKAGANRIGSSASVKIVEEDVSLSNNSQEKR